MDFKEELTSLKAAIEAVMRVYIDEKKNAVQKDDVFLADALQNVAEVILGGGKRLRGALLYHGYKAGGGQEEAIALKAAAGMEFIHSYLLIHDDIMDRDNLRHGVETLHARYEAFAVKHFPEKDAAHFGTSIAITLGDMVCAWGNDCIFSLDLPRERVQRATQKVQSVVHRTGVGQMRDMYIEFLGTATEVEILEMYKDKTAYYSLIGPLQIGLLLAGENEEFDSVFHEYALPLGIAFQLQDDILGLYSEEQELGKTIGSDIAEGKVTLLLQKTREGLSAADQQELTRILRLGEALTESDIAWVRAKGEETGSKAAIEARIQAYIAKAQAVLAASSLPEDTKQFLTGLAEYMHKRTV